MIHLLLLLALGAPAHAEKPAQTLTEQYEHGLKLLKRGYYVKALEEFNQIRIYHRDDPLSVKAELAIADVYFKKGDWDQARLSYDDFARMHPRYPDMDYVYYRMGSCLVEKAPKAAGRDQTWTWQAVNVWSDFNRRFPQSTYQPEVAEFLAEATERLAKKELLIAEFYEHRAAWPAVEGRAKGLVEDWPESSYVPDALGLWARSLAWQGREDEALAVAEKLQVRDAAEGSKLLDELESIKLEPPKKR